MLISYSELCLIGGDLGDNVDALIGQGAENIELMLDGQGWDQFQLRMESLARILLKRKVGYSVHAPVWDVNLTSESSYIREAALESYRQSIVFASMIDASHVVLHPGARSDLHFRSDLARKRAREALDTLVDFNKAYGRLLLVENIGSPESSIFSQEEYADFLSGQPPELGYLVDVGHAFLNGWDIGGLIGSIKDRLFGLHLHDNDGKVDAHLPMGEGKIDWAGIFEAVKGNGRDIELILEYNIGTKLSKLAAGKALLKASGF